MTMTPARVLATRQALSLSVAGLLLALPMSASAAPRAGTTDDAGTTTTAGEDAPGADAKLLLLMDSSGSMAEEGTDGTPKIQAAKKALTAVIDDLDPAQQVGLRVFGGDVPKDQPQQAKCTDSRLAVPIGPGSAPDLTDAVEAYTPTGETPIAYALQEAAKDLGPEGNRTVLLVSDGLATCDPDPCEVAEELSADGLDLVVHTVGLGVDDATRTQLQCIADTAGGSYYDAEDTDSLTTALTRISARAFRPFSVQGTPVEGTLAAQDGPLLDVGGQFTDTFGVSEQPKYYAIRRSSPGTGISVGASAQPEDGRTGMVDLELQTVDGEECVSSRFYAGEATASTVMSGEAHLPSAGPGTEELDACQSATELRLAVTPVDGYEATEGVPFEMRITETPSMVGSTVPEVAELPGWTPFEPSGTREQLMPGASFNDAAPVTPGTTYELDILPGEVLFFRLPVGYGQAGQMRVDADPTQMTPAQRDALGTAGQLVGATAYTPGRDQITNLLTADDGIGSLDYSTFAVVADEASAGARSTGQVRFSNRDLPGEAWSAGDYFFALTSDTDSSGTAIPLAVTFDVAGEAVAPPVPADPAASTAAPTDDSSTTGVAASTDAAGPSTAAPTPSAPAAGSSPDGEGSGLPLPWIVGGAGLLAVAAGVAVLSGRGRRGA